ncbi:hypothetical protein [Rhodococcus daqingensis]|uniref:Uncharacterized protein n=1 Tax=Rhodococcus daqingensis TaxID=2479363 RepID=A0ABW2S163_9NOCA
MESGIPAITQARLDDDHFRYDHKRYLREKYEDLVVDLADPSTTSLATSAALGQFDRGKPS